MRRMIVMALLPVVAGACGTSPLATVAETDATVSYRSEEGILRSTVTGSSLGLPVASMAEISGIHEAFSLSAAAPWGFAHNGIDFTPDPPTGSLMPVVAAEAGRVLFAEAGLNGSNWRVNVGLEHAPGFRTEYVFEPFSSAIVDRDAQLAEIRVRVGQVVGRGALLGRLVAAGSGAHLHFGIRKNDVDVCPAPYFIPAVRREILAKLRDTWPGAELCYP